MAIKEEYYLTKLIFLFLILLVFLSILFIYPFFALSENFTWMSGLIGGWGSFFSLVALFIKILRSKK